MRDYLIRLKVMLDLTALALKVLGAFIGGIFVAIFVFGIFANSVVSWAIPIMIFGFGIFLVGYLLEAIINYEGEKA